MSKARQAPQRGAVQTRLQTNTMQNVYRSTDLDASGWGTKAFSESEKKRIGEALTRKLGNDKLAQRRGPGGGRVTYLEGWQATELANEVFGYNGWSSRIMSLHQDSMECRQGRYVCCYSAVVRIQVCSVASLRWNSI